MSIRFTFIKWREMKSSSISVGRWTRPYKSRKRLAEPVMSRLLVSFSHYNVSMDEMESFFTDKALAFSLFQAVQAMIDSIGESQIKVSKTQISFRNRIIFAITWLYSKGKNPPLMLTVCLRRRDNSPRWRAVDEPYPGRFVHHIELKTSADLDDQIRAWLSEAWFMAS
jgi:hypothetical protein